MNHIEQLGTATLSYWGTTAGTVLKLSANQSCIGASDKGSPIALCRCLMVALQLCSFNALVIRPLYSVLHRTKSVGTFRAALVPFLLTYLNLLCTELTQSCPNFKVPIFSFRRLGFEFPSMPFAAAMATDLKLNNLESETNIN